MTENGSHATRFHLADVSPEPTDDVMAAIVGALESAWPEPSAPDMWRPRREDDLWRFGQRSWLGRQIPMQTWGRL